MALTLILPARLGEIDHLYNSHDFFPVTCKGALTRLAYFGCTRLSQRALERGT